MRCTLLSTIMYGKGKSIIPMFSHICSIEDSYMQFLKILTPGFFDTALHLLKSSTKNKCWSLHIEINNWADRIFFMLLVSLIIMLRAEFSELNGYKPRYWCYWLKKKSEISFLSIVLLHVFFPPHEETVSYKDTLSKSERLVHIQRNPQHSSPKL